MECQIFTGTSKKGKAYSALKIKIGEYENILFPSKIETLYIQNYLKNNSQEDISNNEN